MADYLTQDTACIALNRQPSLLLELGRLRGAEPALLLRAAGIPAARLLDPQRQTLWGAPAPKSWFEEGSVFEGIAVKKPKLKARPIVAP